MGNVMPTTPMLDKQTYASSLSFVGATRRTTRWCRKAGTTPVKATLAITGAVFWLLFMYACVAVWYVVVFGIFGLFMFPFRLIRRSHRKQEAYQRQALATQQAMLLAQQQAMIQNQGGAPLQG
jgi:hypothetical protein